ncbi:unnamed protein product [Bursaphelenchus xylophilus]|uniref:(pine wood nematode) hypothetical protein n=1 Tax=Bursaphelenchus xylophilus TaxID=6326 RepID=A0A7I8X0I2_BURXY|nr:unnamed protein product [Bursaphelenchus xylophilus]CAG9129689.1 unnamed protein product [Bursaphelenchus xylophilus]
MSSVIEQKGYKVTKEIGKGGYGVVYKATDRFGKVVALKKSDIKKGREQGLDLRTEATFMKILSQGDSPERNNFVKYIDSFDDGEYFILVMEYVENGSLFDYVKKEPMYLDAAVYVTLQIVNAVNYMHDKEIMHRDLSPGNILVVPRKDSRSKFIPKICDFGLAKHMKRPKEKHFTVCGTPQFQNFDHMKKGYGPEVDYSYIGALLYFMLTQQPIIRKNIMVSVDEIERKIESHTARDWICQLVMSDNDYERAFNRRKSITTPEEIRSQLKAIECRDKSIPRSQTSQRRRSTSRTLRELENREGRYSEDARRDRFSDMERYRDRERFGERNRYIDEEHRENNGYADGKELYHEPPRISRPESRERQRAGQVLELDPLRRQPSRPPTRTDSHRRLDSVNVPTNVETRRDRRLSLRSIPTQDQPSQPRYKSAPGQKVAPWPLPWNMKELEPMNNVFTQPGRCLLTINGSYKITIEVHDSQEVVNRIVVLHDVSMPSQFMTVHYPSGRSTHHKQALNDPPIPIGSKTKEITSCRELDRDPDLRKINKQARYKEDDRIIGLIGEVKWSGRVELRWGERLVDFDRADEDLVMNSIKGGNFNEDELTILRDFGRGVLREDRRLQRRIKMARDLGLIPTASTDDRRNDENRYR